MSSTKEKVRLSLFDRYVIYRDEHWSGRELIPREVAEDLLAREFFSDNWLERAVVNQAIRAVLTFEKMIRRSKISTERVDVLRCAMPQMNTQDEQEEVGAAAEEPPRMRHVQAEVQTVTGEEWIRRLEKAKEETEGQRRELKRLWGVMRQELKSLPDERRKVEKHFRSDHKFQTLLNIEGIEEE